MSFSTTDTEVVYTGNGADTSFEITYEFQNPAYIKVQKYDLITDPENPIIIDLDEGIDYYITATTVFTVYPDMDGGGNPILVPEPVEVGNKLRIYRDTVDTRVQNYNTYQFPYPAVNNEMDRVHQRLQELRREVDRAIKLNALSLDNGESLTGEEILQTIADLEALIAGLETGAGLPAGGTPGDYLENLDGDTTTWRVGALSGYSARFGEQFNSTGLEDTIAKIVKFQYTPPGISLGASPGQQLREFGEVVSSVSLSANTVKRSNDISVVIFYKNGGLLSTDSTPNPTGGTSSTTDATPFSGPTSYYASVSDGTSTINSNTVSFSYVYPYFYGVGAAGLNAAAIAALTKAVIGSSSQVSFTSSPSSQAFYFAYPSAYPTLTSILDPNGFETISGYTVRTVTITGLDGQPVSYRVYESGITTQVNFTNTYKR